MIYVGDINYLYSIILNTIDNSDYTEYYRNKLKSGMDKYKDNPNLLIFDIFK